MKTESISPSPLKSLHPNWLDCFKSERDRLVLLPRSPSSIFAYWEWTPSRTEAFRNSSLKGDLILRLFNAENKTPAADRHPEISGSDSPAAVCGAEFPCTWDSLRMYIKPPEGPRCGKFYAALFIRTTTGDFQSLLKSNTVQVPTGRPAGKPAGVSEGVPGTGYTKRFKRPQK